MKIHLSKIIRPEGFSIGEDLPKGKCILTCNNEDPETENIWVAKDDENKVMYLLNNSLHFYPFPSWGIELPLSEEFDISKIRGKTVDDTEFSVCLEVYNQYVDAELLNEEDEINIEKLFEYIFADE